MVSLTIIRHGYPFTYAEHKGNRLLHQFLNDDYKPISRNSAKNRYMKIHEREKKGLMNDLSAMPGKICLTCDMWTSLVDQGYLSLTAHYIDSKWNLHSKVLNFYHLEPPHNATTIHDHIFNLLKEWGIHNKIFTITLDNARCNDSMQEMLVDTLDVHSPLPCDGEFFHVRCSARILNLIVQEGLKVIDEGVKKVRKVVIFCCGSERRKLKFQEHALALAVNCSKGLSLDCCTRWNSTFKMLSRALNYRVVFSHMRRVERTEPIPLPPTDEEWGRIEMICKLLKPFDDITILVSGTKYPTANLYFKCVWKIQCLLQEYVSCEDEYVKDVAKRMKIKYEKYWDSYSMILYFAAILDPRYKTPLILYCFNKLEPQSTNALTKNVKDRLNKLFKEYMDRHPQTTTHRNQGRVREDDMLGGFSEFDSTYCTTSRSQLDLYLDAYRLDHTVDLDVLKWWEENGK